MSSEGQKGRKLNTKTIVIAIVAVLSIAFIIEIVTFVVIANKTSSPSNEFEKALEEGNFVESFQEIRSLYDDGKNVDDLVYSFAESCADHGEYKRAIASLKYLSEKADNKEFFEGLVERFLAHNKILRAKEVLKFMKKHSTLLSQYADEIYKDQIAAFEGWGVPGSEGDGENEPVSEDVEEEVEDPSVMVSSAQSHISDGDYDSALQEIEDLFMIGYNVDSLVYDFIQGCMKDFEYDKVVGSLEYLSRGAEEHKEFFEGLLANLLDQREIEKAKEVLDYMRSHGNVLSQCADDFYKNNEEFFKERENEKIL